MATILSVLPVGLFTIMPCCLMPDVSKPFTLKEISNAIQKGKQRLKNVAK